MSADRKQVTVDGRDLVLTNLDKVMYPADGFTKGDVIGYYSAVAPVLMPHLADRPVTRIRYPSGTGEASFYEKNAPRGTPEWVCLQNLPSPGSSKGRASVDYVVVDSVATLVWLSNLAALELHTTQWKIAERQEVRAPDHLVADLDPGESAGLTECVEVALLLRDRFAQDGLTAYPKSSGKKGLHLCCPISAEQPHEVVSGYAKRIARELAEAHGDLITDKMLKEKRTGKVFIDWSQNNAAKTTVSVYSLRNRSAPTVSTPMTWDEVESGMDGALPPRQVLERIDKHGDYFAKLLDLGPRVPD